MPLIVNQVEIHLGRLDCFYDGTLDQCIDADDATVVVAVGWRILADRKKVNENHPRRFVMESLVRTLDEIALRLGTTRTILSLAWLLKHPSGIIPIVGSSNPTRIKDAVKADDLEISRDDWYRILVAAKGERLP